MHSLLCFCFPDYLYCLFCVYYGILWIKGAYVYLYIYEVILCFVLVVDLVDFFLIFFFYGGGGLFLDASI